ncbi:farnesyltransferase [Panus rudis PR-1116 ss-1]|nr:farnesyltransferase [Panus rudis PR-1116 ss-1]
MPAINDDEPQGPQLFSERPEWADVTPVPQYEGFQPIAPILYTPQYKDATDYFRGIVRTGEKSERVLELTEAIIRMNPAHYSAWQYRYHTLLAIKAPLDEELKRMDAIAIQFLKTYQVWHHRRLLLTALHSSSRTSPSSVKSALEELAFITRTLATDAKNYHTWSYRQWILAFFDNADLWEGEMGFIERLLTEDVRNNSAWHHRFFVVFGKGSGLQRGASQEDSETVLKRELAYTKDQISLAPNNPSAWNYLRGVLEKTDTSYERLRSFVELYTVSQVKPDQSVLDLENPGPGTTAELPCVAALEFLADIHEKAGGDEVKKAIEIWKSLANEHDTMRKKYWEFRIKEASL